MTIEPAEKFRSLSEAVILAALIDPDPENPISREVHRLVALYAGAKACLAVEARWPIEAVALRLAKEKRAAAP